MKVSFFFLSSALAYSSYFIYFKLKSEHLYFWLMYGHVRLMFLTKFDRLKDETSLLSLMAIFLSHNKVTPFCPFTFNRVLCERLHDR